MERDGSLKNGRDASAWPDNPPSKERKHPLKSTAVTHAARLSTVLVLCATVACDKSPTAPSSVDVEFSTIDLVQGTGNPVTPGQTLTVAFTGWFYDIDGVDGKGAVFDESTSTPEFVLGDTTLAEGWNRGIEGMRVNGQRRVFVSADLGFGAAVVFEFELLTAEVRLDVPFSITDLVQGTGDPVAAGQTMTVAFTGWLYDPDATDNKGFSFDQSTGFSFTLGDAGLIQGWNQGIEGMQLGGKRRIVVPPELGLGLTPQVGIPAYSTLIFEIELLSIP